MTWQSDTLVRMGALVTGASMSALSLWAQSEGMPPVANNPLACGTRWPGSHPYNRTGVQVYPSLTVAAAVYAWTFTKTPNYAPIGGEFLRAATLAQIWLKINASPWCPHCQTGHYPVALWTAAGSPSSGAAAPPASVSPSSIAPANVVTAWEHLRSYAYSSFPAQMRQWGELARYAQRI